MLKKKLFFLLIITGLVTLILAACSGSDSTSTDNKSDKSAQNTSSNDNASSNDSSDSSSSDEIVLPDSIIMTSYDVGSGGYGQLTAISDALTREYGVKIRMMPSASGMGRLQPLKNGTAMIGGRVADEMYFAFEGIEEFASLQWGPQDVQYVQPMWNHFGFAVLEDSGLETPADLVGKKVPHIIGNASVNIKIQGLLAAYGLTFDDVEIVETASYGGQGKALMSGEIDMAAMVPSAAALYEVDELVGMNWLDLSKLYEEDALEKMHSVYPFGLGDDWDKGAGLGEGESATFLGYTSYAPGVYGDADPDFVYNWLKAIEATYPMYKDASAGMVVWDIDEAVPEPLGVPIHEGAVRFFKERGMWTDEYEEKNNALHERREKLKEAWDIVVEEANEKGLSESEFSAYWLERKAELVD